MANLHQLLQRYGGSINATSLGLGNVSLKANSQELGDKIDLDDLDKVKTISDLTDIIREMGNQLSLQGLLNTKQNES